MRLLHAALGLCLAGLSFATPVPPYGTTTFEPTATTPIGFRADGNGWYPGATPPVEWWDGTPTITMQRLGRNDGVISPTSKPAATWTAGDTARKNIRWKTPMPGWGDAQPIVVQGKVYTICDPDFVLCFDADTGQELWRDQLAVMTLPVLGADRKTVGPAPEAERAKQQQTIWDLSRAMYYLTTQVQDLDAAWDETKPIVEKIAARLTEWRTLVEANDPQFLTAIDAASAKVAATLAAPDAAGRKSAWRTADGGFINAVSRAYRVATGICWQGHVGASFSTPASDGETLVVKRQDRRHMWKGWR